MNTYGGADYSPRILDVSGQFKTRPIYCRRNNLRYPFDKGQAFTPSRYGHSRDKWNWRRFQSVMVLLRRVGCKLFTS